MNKTMNMRASLLPRLSLLVVVGVLAASAGCSILYLTSSSEENLPCGTDLEKPRCLDGYACVVAADDIERCVRANFKEVGETCVSSDECKDGGVCADAYTDLCPTGSTDLNCSRLANADTGLRCRAPCDDANNFACAAGTRCFFPSDDEVAPFCQVGICATDSDCSANGEVGVCVGEALSGGTSGLCAQACEPLPCFDRSVGAGGCPCASSESCSTPPDEANPTDHNICQATGVIRSQETCNAVNTCVDNNTCVLLTTGTQVCQQWCNVNGGAPTCPNGGLCQGVSPSSNLGICPLE
jgi:hypothetical protein